MIFWGYMGYMRYIGGEEPKRGEEAGKKSRSLQAFSLSTFQDFNVDNLFGLST